MTMIFVKKLVINLMVLPALHAPFMNVNKRRLKMKNFIEAQFGCCPLVWMFHKLILRK